MILRTKKTSMQIFIPPSPDLKASYRCGNCPFRKKKQKFKNPKQLKTLSLAHMMT